MAKRHGKDGVVKVGANTVLNTTRWTIDETIPTADATAQGDTADSHLVGIPGWAGSMTVRMDKTDTNGQGALTVGASVTLNLYDDGITAGQTYDSGVASITKKGKTVDMGSVIDVTYDFKGNGALSHPTI